MHPQLCKEAICSLCFNVISDTNCEVIGEAIMNVLEVVLPNLNIEERNKHVICKSCSVKLYAAYKFKLVCIDTEDIMFPYVIDSSKLSLVDLKEVYLKEKGNIQLTDISENQKICRLCIQLLTVGFVSVNEVDADIIDTYIPIVNFCATKDPIICGPCFDSLYTHGDFLKKCLEAQEKYKSNDRQSYIKSEEIEIKLEENGQDLQEQYESLEQQFCIKLEMTEVKVEQGDQDRDSYSYGSSIENKMRGSSEDREEIKNKYMPKRETGSVENITTSMDSNVQIQKSEKFKFQNGEPSLDTQLYQCDKRKHESKFKVDLRKHQLVHKDLSEVRSFKCDKCSYKTKHKSDLKRHHLSHKNPSDIQMYKCDTCTYECKYKSSLKLHQLNHKEILEIQIYKCDTCTYETKYKRNLKLHQLLHKDSSEIQMYKCGACMFETKLKNYLKKHQLKHKNPSEVHIYKCDTCSYGTKYKDTLRKHRLKHKNISEVQTYKCDICDYTTKYKNSLKKHLLRYKNRTSSKRKCDT
ncbi:zinc finger protein 761-like [Anoplophora glabripennis]|uniref:zinc finger protein 761-like n=1 Tax=Anoplophora glabripennis TaxID=217634 RepID=UPI0008743339|nr:zinc finger protein 761-like [Anoplophora glabripennis]